MALKLVHGTGRKHQPRCDQGWIDRCYLPLMVGIAAKVRCPAATDDCTRIALTDGEGVAVASDLSLAVLREVRGGELVCLRLNGGVAVAVDFADGRAPLVSAELPAAAQRARHA